MYIRALQRSQNATLADASPDEQAALDKSKTPPPPAPAPAEPAPAPAPTGAPAPAKPAGSASNGTYRTNGTYTTTAYDVPPRLISDNGYTIIGPTYYEAFASSTNLNKSSQP